MVHVGAVDAPISLGDIAQIITEFKKAVGSAKAGAPYVASKFGQAGMMESLNAELRDRGIRACGIFPGDIDTAILEQRPVPPAFIGL